MIYLVLLLLGLSFICMIQAQENEIQGKIPSFFRKSRILSSLKQEKEYPPNPFSKAQQISSSKKKKKKKLEKKKNFFQKIFSNNNLSQDLIPFWKKNDRDKTTLFLVVTVDGKGKKICSNNPLIPIFSHNFYSNVARC